MSNRLKKQNSKAIIWLRNCLFTLLAIATFGLVYVFQIEPQWFEVVSVEVNIANLAPAFDGFKIVQISDFHTDTSMNSRKLNKIVELVNQQQPDLIAMTGDYVTTKLNNKTSSLLSNALKQLSPREATVAVLGNHDYWANPNRTLGLLASSNAIALSNSLHVMERGDAKLVVAGVDDYWEQKSDLDKVLKQLKTLDNVPAILLAHEPDFADISAASHRFALQLSGHSHGGQVKLPFGKPPVLPPFAHKYPLGRYQVEQMVQYTNRGVGMVLPAVRFNCRPEITVLSLSPAR